MKYVLHKHKIHLSVYIYINTVCTFRHIWPKNSGKSISENIILNNAPHFPVLYIKNVSSTIKICIQSTYLVDVLSIGGLWARRREGRQSLMLAVSNDAYNFLIKISILYFCPSKSTNNPAYMELYVHRKRATGTSFVYCVYILGHFIEIRYLHQNSFVTHSLQ